MSSEKRWMAPNTFDRDVPPLKSNRSLNCSMVKICFSVQQTQRSFSTTASETHAVGGLAEQFRPAGRVETCHAVQLWTSASFFATP